MVFGAAGAEPFAPFMGNLAGGFQQQEAGIGILEVQAPATEFVNQALVEMGYAEASAIPAGWHGWMHHRTDVSPADEKYTPREWQKPHRANPTGTANAYRPQGSIAATGKRPRVTGDYDAWTPGS